MAEPTSRSSVFVLTLKQRRLRTAGAVLLCIVVAMALFGARSPYFGRSSPEIRALTLEADTARRSGMQASARAEAARKAVLTKVLTIYGYWVVCLLLTSGLVLVALLDVREIRRGLLDARRAIWQEIDEAAKASRKTEP